MTGRFMNADRLLRRWWPLALLVVLSAGLRLYHLGSQSLFMDEGKSWAVTLLSPGDIYTLSDVDHHAPLYFLLLKASLTVLPATEAGLRALSAAASAATLVVALAFLVKEWGLTAAVYGGILMALSTFDLYYAQEARMYTLLAAAWVASYVALAKALEGKPRWLALWAVACIALPWTHFYGFLVLGANAVFVAGYFVLKRLHRIVSPLDDRLLLIAGGVIVIGILPMVRLLLLHSDTNSLGASVPQWSDLAMLYLLWSAGLAAARYVFVDGSHLTLPATAALSPAIWFLAGTVICGAPAVFGLVTAWRMQGARRLQAVLALLTIALPVAAAFGYSVVLGNQIWIQRPFLGAAFLVYLWAGIGFAAIRWRRARWLLALLAVMVALASLLPYFTIWQKSDARQAFRSMPAPDQHNLPVLEMRFLTSQARFYLGADAPLTAIEVDQRGMPSVARPSFDQDHPYIKVMGRPKPVVCDDLATVTDLWLYGNPAAIRWALPQLPTCVTEKRLWLFENLQWTQLGSFPRDVIDGSGWLQFDDIRDSDWTTEDYRHLAPGDAIRVVLNRANEGSHQLTVRYYDFRGKAIEVWAAGQLVGRLGDGRTGSGWHDETLDLPATSDESMLIELKSAGTNGIGVVRIGVTPKDQ